MRELLKNISDPYVFPGPVIFSYLAGVYVYSWIESCNIFAAPLQRVSLHRKDESGHVLIPESLTEKKMNTRLLVLRRLVVTVGPSL